MHFLTFLLLMVSAPVDAQPTFEVHVWDRTGVFIRDAEVRVVPNRCTADCKTTMAATPFEGKTDQTGTIRVPAQEGVTYDVLVRAVNYRPEARNYTFHAAQSKIRFSMLPAEDVTVVEVCNGDCPMEVKGPPVMNVEPEKNSKKK